MPAVQRLLSLPALRSPAGPGRRCGRAACGCTTSVCRRNWRELDRRNLARQDRRQYSQQKPCTPNHRQPGAVEYLMAGMASRLGDLW